MIDTKKYILAFLITLAIFASGFFASTFFSMRRAEVVKGIQDNIANDILSNETQFDLLKEVSCQNLNYSVLSTELSDLGEKLAHTEAEKGADDPDVVYLRRYYSLLEIKDYLLSKKIGEKCAAKKPVFIMYFYGEEKECKDCVRTGNILTELKRKYPDLRVYSFDYNSALSAVTTMKKIYKVGDALPVLVIEEKTYSGFKTLDEIESLLPEAFKATATSTDATSTDATTTKKKSLFR